MDVVGSPPRAWGQRIGKTWAAFPCRFTPTRVGTTKHACRAGRFLAVHPHARGDNVQNVEVQYLCGGSPPRAWGQHDELP